MKVIGFIGPSGTGKSHRAAWVAREKGTEYVIDDGLLIKGNRIVAGSSAKKEPTRIASVKRALFVHKELSDEVRKAIKAYKPEKILILGTSEGMVQAISKNLSLPEASEYVRIEDVADEFEIKKALSTRREQGKHVIPVPSFEIKQDFSGYFLDPLQIFRRKGKGSYQLVGEKSVVRPTFSYLGKYTISDYTVYQIVEYIVSQIQGVNKISRFRAENSPDGIHIEMDLVLVFGYQIKPLINYVRKSIRDEIERLTALNIKTLNITVKSLVLPQKQNEDQT
ncbi:MAG: Asp23/Gls24 family envelope stress response protein [Eubacteriales bacterium]|nr:Asp23/Gls24 family envelope stress response protein [Eubacteriales bacterium]